MSTAPTVSSNTFALARTPLVDTNTGILSWAGLQQFLLWNTQLSNGLNEFGQILQSIPGGTVITGRSVGLSTLLQYIDDGGVVLGPGVDFSRAYVNKDTDHIADGTGSPLAGGRAAEIALVQNPPAPQAHRFLTGLVAGVFAFAQVAFGDLMGTAAPSQLPNIGDLFGSLSLSQLPAGGITATVPLAKLTIAGTNGSITYTSGLATAFTAPT